MSATVTSIDTSARRSGGNHRLSLSPTLIFKPEVKSDSSTMTSVMCSMRRLCWARLGAANASPSGPTANPASRYSIDVLTGMRDSIEPPSAMKTSKAPPRASQSANVIRKPGTSSGLGHPARFVQVHRSTIVNLAHLAGTRRDEASRAYVPLFKAI